MLWRQLMTSMGFLFFICVIVARGGTFLLIGFGFEGLARKRLVENGIRTRAEVVRAYRSEESEDLSVRFAYRDHRGELQRRHDAVSRRLFSGLAAGSQIEIRFDPEAPSRSRVEATLRAGWWHEALAVAGAGLGVAAVGWGLTALAVGRVWRRVSLLKKGSRTVGTQAKLPSVGLGPPSGSACVAGWSGPASADVSDGGNISSPWTRCWR